MNYRVLVINPGSTSTKIAVFEGKEKLFDTTLRYSTEELASFGWVMEQVDFRRATIEKALADNNIDPDSLDAICARGGQVPYCAAGTYRVDQAMVDFMYTRRQGAHASNLGCVLALPVAILSSSNINKSLPVVWLIRFILGLIRTLPTLIIALVCALIFSLGTFSGTIAIAVFTFGIVAKMLFESIETIDMGPFEAMEALGANKFQAFWSACGPQILPVYLSHCLYCFEMNVRASAILGYVGAGGLGITINERIGWRDYNSLGTVLLSLFVVVVVIDFFSEYLRKKLS